MSSWLYETDLSQIGYRQPPTPGLSNEPPDHICIENAEPYTDSGGLLGHGWICGECGDLLQVG